jgi:hypothetical protein
MEVGSKFVYVDGTVLITVPGGPFTMGYSFADNPERIVTVSDFWIYSTEVTNRQYALCVDAGKCTPPDPEKAPGFGETAFTNFPVTGVTHDQAAEYCTFVKGRLPTEAEWEKTARGPDGNTFPWGEDAPACRLTNYANCERHTTSVNDYPDGKSYYEAWDMGGNVREWTADWYEPLYNIENPVADPGGPETGEKRSVRGAGFTDFADATISAKRFSLDPKESNPDLGFRCVVEDPIVFAPWCQLVGYAGPDPVEGTPGACTPDIKCNSVSVQTSPSCSEQNNAPYTIIKFNIGDIPPSAVTVGIPFGCTLLEQTPAQIKYSCLPPAGGFARITGSCTDSAGCEATCPVNYTKDGDVCVWSGGSLGGTECVPGSTYDPLTQCCTSDTDSGIDFNLCPSGYYPLEGVCIPNPSTIEPQDSEEVFFSSCTPGGGKIPDGGSCTLSPNSCGGGTIFCASTCSCIPITAGVCP